MDLPTLTNRPIVKSGMEIPVAAKPDEHCDNLFCGADGLVFLIEDIE